jgi:hypothetical protein
MATIAFSGALHPKKKAELQEIATALQISDVGTKEELQNRIKGHLEKNQSKLEEEPAFVGLFGRVKRKRQGSEKPLVIAAPRLHHDDSSNQDRPPRRVTAINPVRESTPVNEERNVSSMLRNAFNFRSPTSTSSSALITSPTKTIRDIIPTPSAMLSVVKRQEEVAFQHGNDMLLTLRYFLSNSRNIWSLTALFELLYVLYAIIPWAIVNVPLSPTSSSKYTRSIDIPYPPIAALQTSAFWNVLYHWFLPTLLIPAFFGILISFRPVPRQSPSSPRVSNPPFDALTASIIRLAAQVVYPYNALEEDLQGVDVLGWRWRVVGAGVGMAFAFAEAISGSSVPTTPAVEDED